MNTQRVGWWLVVVAGVLWAASPVGAATAKFKFQAKQILAYAFDMKATGTDGGTVQGQVVLKVLKVKPDGSAEIELTASGHGTMGAGAEAMEITDEPSSPMIITVKPNGSITSMKDTSGKPFSAMTSMESFFSGANIVSMQVTMSYTLFGLYLPKTLPAVGKKWTGYYKQEQYSTSEEDMPAFDPETMPDDPAAMEAMLEKAFDPSKMKRELKQVPVTFTYKGMKKYQGRTCLVFSCQQKGFGQYTPPAETIYFDAALGQVVGWEVHEKDGEERMDVVMRLVPQGKPSATPPAAKPPSETPPPAETPAAEDDDDDFVPVVR